MKVDWVIVGTLIVITITFCFLMHEFYKRDFNECTRNPLTYSARVIEERFNSEFVGTGFFIVTGESPIIIFNKENVTIKYPEKEKWGLMPPTINFSGD